MGRPPERISSVTPSCHAFSGWSCTGFALKYGDTKRCIYFPGADVVAPSDEP